MYTLETIFGDVEHWILAKFDCATLREAEALAASLNLSAYSITLNEINHENQ